VIAERPGSTTKATVVGYAAGSVVTQADSLATEEPLEIRISIAGRSRTVAVTMRTPGADFELAVGFLFGEGVIARPDQVVGVSYCKDTDLPAEQLYNIVIVELDPTNEPDLRPLDRHFYTSSACGVCGKANLEAIALRGTTKVDDAVTVDPNVLSSLPDKLGQVQAVFSSTGGLHAAALFTSQGELIGSREDVGRHNALDKLIGWSLLDDRIPLRGQIVMVSGRSSYELAQKCVTAGVPILCSVSAPSSLAVDVANEFGMTLVGFLRGDRFNVYAGSDRVVKRSS
jgi:FdhD protein